jgi:hypothetical protein
VRDEVEALGELPFLPRHRQVHLAHRLLQRVDHLLELRRERIGAAERAHEAAHATSAAGSCTTTERRRCLLRLLRHRARHLNRTAPPAGSPAPSLPSPPPSAG